jgi:hypothetical protein
MRSALCAAALCVLTLAPRVGADPIRTDEITLAVERPQGPRPALTLVTSFGALAHATTGTVARYGYDSATAPALGVSARLLFPMPGCRCLAHGVELNYQGASGPDFGLGHGAAFTQHIADASYAVRVELPCLRRGDRRWWVTGSLGLSMRIADAGTGDRPLDDGAPAERTQRICRPLRPRPRWAGASAARWTSPSAACWWASPSICGTSTASTPSCDAPP